jgi:hypothetical protein
MRHTRESADRAGGRHVIPMRGYAPALTPDAVHIAKVFMMSGLSRGQVTRAMFELAARSPGGGRSDSWPALGTDPRGA